MYGIHYLELGEENFKPAAGILKMRQLDYKFAEELPMAAKTSHLFQHH